MKRPSLSYRFSALRFFAVVRASAAEAVQDLPFKDAVAVWQMAGQGGQNEEGSRLTIEGNVKPVVNHGEVTFEGIRVRPLLEE
jgi:hypothetical protein